MYTKYNYRSGTDYSWLSIVNNFVALLCGVTDKTWLKGKVLLSSATIGITNGSPTVTWDGAVAGVTCAVGQKVTGTGIPASTTISSISDGVSLTLSANATATNAAAILALWPTSAMPPSTIGSTTKALGLTSASNSVSYNAGNNNGQIVAVGMQVTGNGIPASTTVSAFSTTTITLNNNATATIANATLMFTPPTTPTIEADTDIITTYTTCSQWEPWDQYAYVSGAGGPFTFWMRSQFGDDANNYKYVGFQFDTTGVWTRLAEGVNQSTHAFTNIFSGAGVTWTASGVGQAIVTTGGTFYVSASNRHVAFIRFDGSSTGATNALDWVGVFERSRDTAWDTVAAAYPPVVTVLGRGFGASGGGSPTPNYSAGAVRIKKTGAADGTADLTLATLGFGGGISGVYLGSNAAGSGPAVPVVRSPDGLGGFYYQLQHIYVRAGSVGFLGGSITTPCDVWVGPATMQFLDELIYNSKIYVAWQNSVSSPYSASSTFSGFTFFPKG